MTDYHGLARELAHLPNLNGEDMAAGSIAAQLQEAWNDGLEEAAAKLEAMRFLFTIQRPGTGPFTRQDITMREVIEQSAAAIRALKGCPSAEAAR